MVKFLIHSLGDYHYLALLGFGSFKLFLEFVELVGVVEAHGSAEDTLEDATHKLLVPDVIVIVYQGLVGMVMLEGALLGSGSES